MEGKEQAASQDVSMVHWGHNNLVFWEKKLMFSKAVARYRKWHECEITQMHIHAHAQHTHTSHHTHAGATLDSLATTYANEIYESDDFDIDVDDERVSGVADDVE
eukprot:1153113-Pelagomonas_calceolata.AAC.2